MLKKTIFFFLCLVFVLGFSGCKKTTTQNTNNTGDQEKTSSAYVTDQTDYVIFYTQSSPAVMGGVTTNQYIVGHPIPEAETIKYNAYFVPWRIDFSQVQRTDLSIWSGACDNLEEQVVYIEGWIDLDLSELEANANNLPDYGPVSLNGTVHEKVSGTAGKWVCGDSEVANVSTNQGSIDYVQSVSGDHVANFSDASNMTSMTINGADIYLDLSVPENIHFIWPAGTKIEFAPEGTPVPLAPLPPNDL